MQLRRLTVNLLRLGSKTFEAEVLEKTKETRGDEKDTNALMHNMYGDQKDEVIL